MKFTVYYTGLSPNLSGFGLCHVLLGPGPVFYIEQEIHLVRIVNVLPNM